MFLLFQFQNFYAPLNDPNLIVEAYERDFDQNDFLGLNDINTENYLVEKWLELDEKLKSTQILIKKFKILNISIFILPNFFIIKF